MKKTTKIVALALAFVLVVVIAIGATVAYLTATSGPITNTFTVGKIEITLTESDNLTFKIVPGATNAKDPTITVLNGSEKCYVYALVENNVTVDGFAVATPNIASADWSIVATNGTKTLYRYKEIVDASAADVPLALFTQVAYSSGIKSGDFPATSNPQIIVNAFAHQSDNVEQTVADGAAKTHFGLS